METANLLGERGETRFPLGGRHIRTLDVPDGRVIGRAFELRWAR